MPISIVASCLCRAKVAEPTFYGITDSRSLDAILRLRAGKNMNGTKIEILNCLSDGEWWTTPEVAQECGLSLTNASELLRRYRGQSLVNRQRNREVPRGFIYRITQVGLERLQYLTSDVVEASSAIASHAGLSGAKKRVFDRWVQEKLRR